ncbi:MAG: hypothetical protein V1798_11960, partial [Pseudomonadota bacterium]
SRFATIYSGSECPPPLAAYWDVLTKQGSPCGAWEKGGVGGRWKTDRRDNRSYTFDDRLLGNLPDGFRQIFPAVATQNPIPYEKTNFRRLTAADLSPALFP